MQNQGLTMDLLSKYVAEMYRAFSAFLTLFDIQDTLNQISALNSKALIVNSHLPEFVSAQLLSRLMTDGISLEETLVSVGDPYGWRCTRWLRVKCQCFRYCSGDGELKQLLCRRTLNPTWIQLLRYLLHWSGAADKLSSDNMSWF